MSRVQNMYDFSPLVHSTTSSDHEIQYWCRCASTYAYCEDIVDLIMKRGDASLFEKLEEGIEYRMLVPLVMEFPPVLYPVILNKHDSGIEVITGGGWERSLPFKTEYLTTLVSGEGVLAIIESLRDAFSAHHVANNKTKSVYLCTSLKHDFANNEKMQKRLHSKASAGNEMIRLSLTGSCTPCANTKTRSMSAGEAFKDMIPSLDDPPKSNHATWKFNDQSRTTYGSEAFSKTAAAEVALPGDRYADMQGQYEFDGKNWIQLPPVMPTPNVLMSWEDGVTSVSPDVKLSLHAKPPQDSPMQMESIKTMSDWATTTAMDSAIQEEIIINKEIMHRLAIRPARPDEVIDDLPF